MKKFIFSAIIIFFSFHAIAIECVGQVLSVESDNSLCNGNLAYINSDNENVWRCSHSSQSDSLLILAYTTKIDVSSIVPGSGDCASINQNYLTDDVLTLLPTTFSVVEGENLLGETFDPASLQSSYGILSNGNKTIHFTHAAQALLYGNLLSAPVPENTKTYLELTLDGNLDGNNGIYFGIASVNDAGNIVTTYRSIRLTGNGSSNGYYHSDQEFFASGKNPSTANGTVIALAIDLVDGRFWASDGQIIPDVDTPGFTDLLSDRDGAWYVFVAGWEWTGSNAGATINVGDTPFALLKPAGYEPIGQ